MNNVLNQLNWLDSYNALTGAIIAVLSMIFGEHWFLFAAFLLLNVIDLKVRTCYEKEAYKNSWSVRILQRNVSTDFLRNDPLFINLFK